MLHVLHQDDDAWPVDAQQAGREGRALGRDRVPIAPGRGRGQPRDVPVPHRVEPNGTPLQRRDVAARPAGDPDRDDLDRPLDEAVPGDDDLVRPEHVFGYVPDSVFP